MPKWIQNIKGDFELSYREVVETADQLTKLMLELRVTQKLVMQATDPIHGMELERPIAELRKLWKQALPKEYTDMFDLSFDMLYHPAIWQSSEIEDVRERAQGKFTPTKQAETTTK
tara:strand:+ start:203 stop:550 length:348 start_codon:yes stop_codon:yes gene_type:complete